MSLPPAIIEALAGRLEDIAETQEDPAFFQGLAKDPVHSWFVHWQFILGNGGDDEGFADQVERLRSLEHPSLARFRNLETTPQGSLLISEVPEGVIFSRVEETQRDELYLQWLSQALALLHYLHGEGWLHLAQNEDSWLLAPATEDQKERLILTDLAVFPERPLGSRVQPGSLVATSPEIWIGGTVDARSDLYSLACLFLKQRNRAPFARFDTPKKLLDLHRGGRMADFVPKTPSLLNDLLRRMLQVNPEDRPASALACLRELRQVSADEETEEKQPLLQDRIRRRQVSLILTTMHSLIQEGEWSAAESMLHEVRPHFQEGHSLYLDYLETYLSRHQDPRKLLDQHPDADLDPRLKILFSLERAVGKVRLGEASAALDILNEAEEAAQDYPDPEVHARVLVKRARLLREKLYEASAMEEFFLAFEKTRDLAGGRLRLAICAELADLFLQNDLSQPAEILLREALALAADQPDFQARLKVMMGLSLMKSERWEEAQKFFYDAKSLFSSAKRVEDLIWASAHELRLFLAQGDYERARREWKVLQARSRNLNCHREWLLMVQALVWMETGELPSPETESDVSPLITAKGNFSELGWGREDTCRLLARLARRLGREDLFESYLARAEKLKAQVARSLDRFRGQIWKWEGKEEAAAGEVSPSLEAEDKARLLEEENRRLQEELQKLASQPAEVVKVAEAPLAEVNAAKKEKPAASAESQERKRIEESLRRHQGNRERTAKELGINRRTLFAKLEKYKLKDLTFGPTREEVEEILKQCGGKKNEAAKKMKMSRATFYRYLKDLGL